MDSQSSAIAVLMYDLNWARSGTARLAPYGDNSKKRKEKPVVTLTARRLPDR